MKEGNIGVTTDNIFPVIKKFLYSDHEIFLRELVSNAVDATQKLKTLSSVGEFKGELGNLNVYVKLGKGTITISDRGIGMTAEEIEALATALANKLSVTNDDVSEKDSVDVEEVAEAMITAGLPKPAREAAFRRIRSGESVKDAIAGEENYMKSLSEALKAKAAEESSAVFRRDTDSNEPTYCFRLRGF